MICYFEPEVLFDALDAVCRGFADEVLPGNRMWAINEFLGVIFDHIREGTQDPGGKFTLG